MLLVRDDTRTPPFVAKVSDFGLAQELAVDASLVTQTYGTVTHMPVELVCDGTLTAAADVYAFGVMLWELYTGVVVVHECREIIHVAWPNRTAAICWAQPCAVGGAETHGLVGADV